MTPDDIRAASANPQVAAFLRVIRQGETNQSDDAYSEINGGSHFVAPPWVHPYAGLSAPPGRAAGAFQDIPHTWARLSALIGAPDAGEGDFSPARQERGNVADIMGHAGALEAIVAGDVALAISILPNEWTSLKTMALSTAEAVFQQFGGVLAADPAKAPEPSEDAPAPVADAPIAADADAEPTPVSTVRQPQGTPMGALALPFLTTILPSVIGLFAPKTQSAISKATGASPDAAAQFMQNLMTQVAGVAKLPVTDQTTAIQAVAAVTQPDNSQAIADLEAHCLDYLDKVSPLLDKMALYEAAADARHVQRMDAAQARGSKDKKDMAPRLVKSSEGLAWFIIAALFGMLGAAFYLKDQAGVGALVGLLGPILTLIMKNRSEIYSYRFDGTADVATVDEAARTLDAANKKGASEQ
jgi:muramidase (phage lysozyme)